MNEGEINMKKNIIIGVAALIVVIGLGLGAYNSNASQASPNYSVQEISDLVTAQYPGTITEVELEKKGSDLIYEVEVENGKIAYEIKLDANTGVIIRISEKVITAKQGEQSSEAEKEDETAKDSNETPSDVVIEEKPSESKSDNNEEQASEKEDEVRTEITSKSKPKQDTKPKQESKPKQEEPTTDVGRAIQIAQKEFSGMVTEVELDRDNGQLLYELEIFSNGQRAEIEVAIESGEIIKKQIKHKNHKYENVKGLIGIEKAINIALGEFPGQVTEAELDKDNGQLIYQVEIKSNDTEADFDIDAYTGKVISIEIDD